MGIIGFRVWTIWIVLSRVHGRYRVPANMILGFWFMIRDVRTDLVCFEEPQIAHNPEEVRWKTLSR